MTLKISAAANWKHPSMSGMKNVERQLSETDYRQFCDAVEKGNETTAHNILAKNPIIFEPVLERVGHHAMWFKNKPEIRPTLTNGKPGQIPDCLIAGKGSGGVEWFIVELKSPKAKLFHPGGYFSSEANKGLNQLARYMAYANEKQGAIRDALEIREFKTPQGIFVIGRRDETDQREDLEQLKSFWRSQLSNIQIVSYSRLVHAAAEVFQRRTGSS
ncbi:Shedu anti-phage system protein SduA domain-containing protein [Pyruvatibacter mobilis]|uniref:Shedu anti-phage system protein SduA domain-containing protein n=1 Tax=Pyruvatibacter mobilis TaxID=1712261 RepID=UPI003BB033D2